MGVLYKDLLTSQEIYSSSTENCQSSWLGLYSQDQFALKLREDIKIELDKEGISPKKINASSTSIHETTHWWQHIGSNFGFIYSMSYLSIVSMAVPKLKLLVNNNIKCKSVLGYVEECYKKDLHRCKELNLIANTYYDIKYALEFSYNNLNFRTIIDDRRYFSNIGHSYRILWDSVIHSLNATLGNSEVLPSPNNWNGFEKLEKKKCLGFYNDSPMVISPLGIAAIFEGQARFTQLQYLSATLKFSYYDAFMKGLLDGIYGEAFGLYLKITKIEVDREADLLGSEFGLFLLVCDIAINPNNGFPLDIYDFESFVVHNDPGIRFTKICHIISQNPPYFLEKIKSYSMEEYTLLSNELSDKSGFVPVMKCLETVCSWAEHSSLTRLMDEERTLSYDPANLPIRVLFSKYIKFQMDKYKFPNVFCWFGYHASNSNSRSFDTANDIYSTHKAMFVGGDNNQVEAQLFQDIPREAILKRYNEFYADLMMYKLIYEWITEDGEFSYNYSWLRHENPQAVEPFLKENFKSTFGVYPEELNFRKN